MSTGDHHHVSRGKDVFGHFTAGTVERSVSATVVNGVEGPTALSGDRVPAAKSSHWRLAQPPLTPLTPLRIGGESFPFIYFPILVLCLFKQNHSIASVGRRLLATSTAKPGPLISCLVCSAA